METAMRTSEAAQTGEHAKPAGSASLSRQCGATRTNASPVIEDARTFSIRPGSDIGKQRQ